MGQITNCFFFFRHTAAEFPRLMDIDVDGLVGFNPSSNTKGHAGKRCRATSAKAAGEKFFFARKTISVRNSVPTTVLSVSIP